MDTTSSYQQNIQDQLNRNQQVFASNPAPVQRYGSGPGQTPYFTPGAFRILRAAIWTAIFAPVMLRIGQNWYAQTGDMKTAIGKSIVVSAMWKVWGTAIFWWMCINSVLASPDENWFTADQNEPPVPNNPTIIMVCRLMQWVTAFALVIAYCKLVDMSLFKHRFVYRLFQPIRRWTDWCPWVVLISMVMMPVFFYIQMAVVQV